MSEAQDPSVTEVSNEPVAQVRAADSDDPAVLRQKLELVQHDSRTKGETNKALKKGAGESPHSGRTPKLPAKSQTGKAG